MRYAVISRGLPFGEMLKEVQTLGAKNIKVAQVSEQVFCDLEEGAAAKLSNIPGILVKPVGEVRSVDQLAPPKEIVPPSPVSIAQGAYGWGYISQLSRFYQARDYINPPALGGGYTVAILDSGIRKTHVSLRGKVLYEANFSDSPTADDIYDHGTAVAYVAAGGRHIYGEEAGAGPGINLFNIKVLNDEGMGSTESVVLGIEEVIRLQNEAQERGEGPLSPMFPNMINLSLGSPDDGDPDNPIRVACRRAIREDIRISTVAAAGNSGPGAGSIATPAADPLVIAVGALNVEPYNILDYSSRGPTKEGYIKPDLVFFGDRLLLASAKSDTAFSVRSGTSFAAPAIAGVSVLVKDLVMRITGDMSLIYAPMEKVFELFPPSCRKPSGAPMGKDNAYGFGMPFGDLILKMFNPPSPTSQMIPSLSPILGLGLAGMVMGGMVKSLKERR